MWHLSTQLNNGLLDDYIAFFDPGRGRRRFFITCLVYAMVYPSIASNLVNLATLSPRSDSIYTHTDLPSRGNPSEVTQDHRNQATNKLVCSIK